ncbi:MAG: hypothetical protein U9R75_08520 [Candidatus Thermoplasmatota archaeon]|nr:hypothetical protein [Candidatus Thermoplasmatota archaeon]
MPPAWEDTYDEAQKKTEDTRRKMFIDAVREKIPAIDPELAFLTPTEILEAQSSVNVIKEYHEKIKGYKGPGRKIGLLFPDSDRKPWTKGKTDSLIYRNLFTSLKNLDVEGQVAIYTISPVLGVVPSEWYPDIPMYDGSGAQSFMVRRRGFSWNIEDFRKVISNAADILVGFLEENHQTCDTWHVIFRAPSVHKRIFEVAMDKRPFPIWPHPSKKSLADSYLKMKTTLKEIIEG